MADSAAADVGTRDPATIIAPEPEPERIIPAQQVVVDSATGTVKRIGYCDFENDGSFKPDSETILRQGIDYDDALEPVESINEKELIWDPSGAKFDPGAAIPPPGPPPFFELSSPDGSVWRVTVADDGTLVANKPKENP